MNQKTLKQPALWAIIGCLLISMIFGYADVNTAFEYQNRLQLWRLITAHFSHYSVLHLITNLSVMLLLLHLFPMSVKQQLKAAALTVLMIDFYLLFQKAPVYLGISGILYAILGFAFAQQLKKKSYLFALFILSVTLLYIYELAIQINTLKDPNWKPLSAAHLLGFFAGIMINLPIKKFIKLISFKIHTISLSIGLICITQQAMSKPLMIAHAGGGIKGQNYSNSIEALDLNYAKGFRYFEIDFSWSSDRQLVCLHDWHKRFTKVFGHKTKKTAQLC